VRDLSGYFEDCGCSGSLRGGVARLPAIAPSIHGVSYLFLGRTIVPNLDVSTDTSKALVAAQTPVYLEQARQVFSTLGSPRWVLEDDEAQELDARVHGWREKMKPWLGLSHHEPWAPISLVEGELLIAGKFRVPLPQPNNRGRDVVVIGMWANDQSGAASMNTTLGALWKLAAKSETIASKLSLELKGASGPVFSYWRSELHQGVFEDAALKSVLGKTSIGFAHGRPTSARLPVAFDSASVASKWNTCASCHPKAFEAWSISLHAHPLKTLYERGREFDGRCVPCHVQTFTVRDSKPEVEIKHAAVTCMNCHGHKDRAPLEVCRDCHTELADPQQRFAAAIQSICPGDTKSGNSGCER